MRTVRSARRHLRVSGRAPSISLFCQSRSRECDHCRVPCGIERDEEKVKDDTLNGDGSDKEDGSKSGTASGNSSGSLADVKSIKFKDELYTVDVGVSVTLSVVGDNGAPISANCLSFESADSAVATVSSDGVLTGVAGGRIAVTAKLKGTGLSATCTVLVSMGCEEIADGETKYEVIYTKSVSSNGKKHLEKGRGTDNKKKAFDVEVVVLKNGEKLPQSAYKTAFKKNKKPGTGQFKVTLKKKATGASKSVLKTIKKKWYSFEIK